MKKPFRCLEQPKGQKEPHDGGYEIPAEKTESVDSASCGIGMYSEPERLLLQGQGRLLLQITFSSLFLPSLNLDPFRAFDIDIFQLESLSVIQYRTVDVLSGLSVNHKAQDIEVQLSEFFEIQFESQFA